MSASPARTTTAWVTSQKERINVSDMSDSHLANSINLIHRKAKEVTRAFKFFPGVGDGEKQAQQLINGIVTYDAMIEEVKKRRLFITPVPCFTRII
jgi:hypothetical protein